jgi:N-terminal acetyltransferase B complex non-catalytic subunit
LIYLLASSIPEVQRSSFTATTRSCVVCRNPCGLFCDVCLKSLAYCAINSYGTAIKDDGKITSTLLSTDRHPADDLCILSSMCLVKLSVSAEDGSDALDLASISYILRAALLLEYAWSHSKSNFQILLVLVKLYSRMGCGSLAMRAYQRLGVKQIQRDTLSHTMFDRISSLHPHAFGHSTGNSSELRSPLDHLSDQQSMYRSAIVQTNKNLWKSFRLGSYNSVVGITEFNESLSYSMAKIMSVVESRRISRLVKPTTPLLSSYSLLRKCMWPSYFA